MIFIRGPHIETIRASEVEILSLLFGGILNFVSMGPYSELVIISWLVIIKNEVNLLQKLKIVYKMAPY